MNTVSQLATTPQSATLVNILAFC